MMASIEKRQEDIVRSFENLGDWMDKYEYLIGLGKRLPPMDAAFKNDANAIGGCRSKVWMTAEVRDGKVHFLIDSDTLITKGLIGLLLQVLDRQSPAPSPMRICSLSSVSDCTPICRPPGPMGWVPLSSR
jgi:cysteine desulfuration protein SufE